MTKRDQDILAFIKNYMKENGTTPTIREIGDGVGLYGTSSVHVHFQRLVGLGYIEQNNHRYTVKGMKYVEVDGSGNQDM